MRPYRGPYPPFAQGRPAIVHQAVRETAARAEVELAELVAFGNGCHIELSLRRLDARHDESGQLLVARAEPVIVTAIIDDGPPHSVSLHAPSGARASTGASVSSPASAPGPGLVHLASEGTAGEMTHRLWLACVDAPSHIELLVSWARQMPEPVRFRLDLER